MQAAAVAAGGVENKFMRHLRVVERGAIDLAADHVGFVVLVVDDECGRDRRGELQLVRDAARLGVEVLIRC